MKWSMLTAAAACTFLMSARTAVRADGDAAPEPGAWNARAAAAYLDNRATWWAQYPNAARDHGTFCVSCHTALPYALARPALRTMLGETQQPSIESRLVANVVSRVNLWNEIGPYYPDQLRGIPKTSESRGTEAILNALVLATRDASSGRLASDTRAAFDHLWALQMRTQELSGAWAWLNFKYEPWESPNAPYFGAALAALAIGTAPESYAATPDIQQNLNLLRAYVQRDFERQPLFNKLMMLWASAKLPALLSPEQRRSVVDAAFASQQADGGWSTASLGTWTRIDNTPLDTASDGYGTGVAALALQEAGIGSADARVARALAWLRQHQEPNGRWSASSLNKQRDPESDAGRFMSDAATGFAVLALTQPPPHPGTDARRGNR